MIEDVFNAAEVHLEFGINECVRSVRKLVEVRSGRIEKQEKLTIDLYV